MMNIRRKNTKSLLAQFWLGLTMMTWGALSAATIDPSLITFTEKDMLNFPAAIDTAVADGAMRVNFVPTFHNRIDLANNTLEAGLYRVTESYVGFAPFTPTMVSQIKEHFVRAFTRCREHKLGIAVLPHYDATGAIQEWRNMHRFDPLKTYDGSLSYYDGVLKPIIEALEETQTPETAIDLSLQGEMGYTVFAYPESWLKILREVKQRRTLPQMQVGLSFNHGGINGGAEINDAQRLALQSLIDEADFIGISAYHKVHVPVTTASFTWCIDDFMKEWKDLGLNIPTDKPIHFSEVGLGGVGVNERYENMGLQSTPAQIALTPYLGVPDISKSNPWEDPDRRAFRRNFYQALIDFVKSQPASHKVTHVYLWNMGSFCPHGYLGVETGFSPSRDQEIVDMINAHNRSIKH